MSFGTKLFLAVAGGVILLTAATVGVAAGAVYRAGTIEIDVHDTGGTQLSMNLPAGLANLAIALAPSDLVDDVVAEIEPWLPAARAGWNELEGASDFVLVEIEGPGEHVRLEKRGRTLLIAVDSPDARVHVVVPLNTVGSLLDKIDRRRVRL